MAVRAAIYSRYCDDGQSETSIAAQQRHCRQRAHTEQGGRLEHESADYAISGVIQVVSSIKRCLGLLPRASSKFFSLMVCQDLRAIRWKRSARFAAWKLVVLELFDQRRLRQHLEAEEG